MKRCSCEHWQICPTCYPQGFDEHGVRKPVEVPPSREELQRQAVALREQVEKLTKERNAFQDQCIRLKNDRAIEKGQLAALAEQNEKMREALIAISIAWSSNEIYSQHFFNEALPLPNLATPVLNRIRAEGMRFPLPKEHWLYKEREYEDGAIEPNDLPAPILTRSFRRQVIAAIRYAVRSATNFGKEDDFDPDALVQNAVYALCGPYGKAAPTPTSVYRKELELYGELLYAVANKFPGESRHQTALRYIRNAEKGSDNAAMQEGTP